MQNFQAVCNYENLYRAHLRARKGKRGTAEVIAFEMELPQNLSRLQQELSNRTYRLSGYYNFEVFEPKRRTIHALHYRDRVVQHCLCGEVLTPVLDKRLIHDNAACRTGKGTDFARARLSGFLHGHFKRHGSAGYFLKCDIRKFFDCIDHQVLKQKLGRVGLDTDSLSLLHHIIDSYHTVPGKGIPMGNQTSQWFALYYLDTLDRLVKEKLRIQCYTRYMDDCVLVHSDKAYLQECLRQMTTLLHAGLQLEFNRKTRIFPMAAGVEYLGFRFHLTETGKVIRRLKTQTKWRFKRKLRHMQKQYAEGLRDYSTIKPILCSYRGYLRKGHCWRMQAHTLKSFVLCREPAG